MSKHPLLPLSRSARLRGVCPAPPRWEAAFGRRAPLEVDLGCGRGDYALERAAQRPEIDMVALDMRRSWIEEIRRRARQKGLANIKAIRCDVSQDLPVLFAPATVTGFTIFHPDPWWKKRQRKRRLVRPEFVALLAGLLRPGGWVYLQTDVPDLAEEIRNCFSAQPLFCAEDAECLRRTEAIMAASRRERRCLALGIPLVGLAYRRKQVAGECARAAS